MTFPHETTHISAVVPIDVEIAVPNPERERKEDNPLRSHLRPRKIVSELQRFAMGGELDVVRNLT